MTSYTLKRIRKVLARSRSIQTRAARLAEVRAKITAAGFKPLPKLEGILDE